MTEGKIFLQKFTTLLSITINMNSLSDYSALIEQRIKNTQYPGAELAPLYEPIAYGMSAGGKRIRPALLLLTADAFGEKAEKAMPQALGVEMFHNFTLLHDDVMDNSDTRRGRPSVFAKWGVNSAILSGDTMLTLATKYIADTEDCYLRQVISVFNDMAIKVYEGQQLDMDFEDRDDVSLEEYIRMIKDKTGALLAASAKIGAIIGGASEKDAELMYEYGIQLGVAFQIQDDWLDVYGDAATFGKPIGGDINNNKKTFLMFSALNYAGPEREALTGALQLPAGPLKVKTVTRLYDKMNLSSACREAVNKYSSAALAAVKKTNLPDERKEPYIKLVEKLTGRKK